MKITAMGINNNFAALNPPDWLARDLACLSAQLPDFKLLTLFADDLPNFDLLERPALASEASLQRCLWLEEVCQHHYGDERLFHPAEASNVLEVYGRLANARRGYSLYNIGQIPSQLVTDSLTGRSIEILRPNAVPSAAIFILPPRELQPHVFVSETTGLPSMLCTRFYDVNIHRAVLGHEWGHTLTWAQRPQTLLWRTDEHKADLNSKTHCLSQGDAATAEFFSHWRALHNFLGPVCRSPYESGSDTSDYWNDLKAAGHKIRSVDEYAAQLEVRLLSMRLVPAYQPGKPYSFVRAAFNELGDPAHMAICEARYSPLDRLRNLADAHPAHSYTYAHSEALASRIMRAAGALAPMAL